MIRSKPPSAKTVVNASPMPLLAPLMSAVRLVST
jgi:hypothetical protein